MHALSPRIREDGYPGDTLAVQRSTADRISVDSSAHQVSPGYPSSRMQKRSSKERELQSTRLRGWQADRRPLRG